MAFKVTTLRLSEETVKTVEDLANKLLRKKSEVTREALPIGIREMKIRWALDLYSEGKISFGRMVKLTGLGYREISLELKRRNVPLRYGEERLML